MRSVAVVLLGLVALVASNKVGIGEELNGAYYCVAEVAGGLSYDSSQKAWLGTSFKANNKFVLRITFIDTKRIPVPVQGVQETLPLDFKRYQVKITTSGTDEMAYCDGQSIGSEQHIVAVYGTVLRCATHYHEFGFNLETKRFEMVYMHGDYVFWRQEFASLFDKSPPPTDYVAGGTCTKIE